jgi:hypothetical protein
MPQPQDNLARDLRAAVLANDHEKASRLSAEYSAALREYWMTLSPEERVASSIPKQSLELLHWVRDMTLMQQAMAARHLRVTEKTIRYRTARALYLQSDGPNTR